MNGVWFVIDAVAVRARTLPLNTEIKIGVTAPLMVHPLIRLAFSAVEGEAMKRTRFRAAWHRRGEAYSSPRHLYLERFVSPLLCLPLDHILAPLCRLQHQTLFPWQHLNDALILKQIVLDVTGALPFCVVKH